MSKNIKKILLISNAIYLYFEGYSCDAGHYLDLANQTCQKCPIGTYSLGSGIRFDSWNELPEGFATHSETLTFAQYGYTTKADNCNS